LQGKNAIWREPISEAFYAYLAAISLKQLSQVTMVCMPVTMVNNFLQSPFKLSSLQTSPKQKQLTLSHNAKTNCHNPKIDHTKNKHFTCQQPELLRQKADSARR
jgi:hypothetical protein